MKKEYNKPIILCSMLETKEIIASTSQVNVLEQRWNDDGDTWASFFE